MKDVHTQNFAYRYAGSDLLCAFILLPVDPVHGQGCAEMGVQQFYTVVCKALAR
ncbi:hypothetical protein D3C75_1133970 [compost metagenome]